jgi:retron-type reverse transcriptase
VEIHNDNGTNFIKVANKMDKEFKEVIKQATKNAAVLLINDGKTWKFIPRSTPHLEGVWEAGV